MVSFEAALSTLHSAGADVIDNPNFPAADDFKKLNQQVKGIMRSSELKRDIAQYLNTLQTNPNHIYSTEDILEFTQTNSSEEYPARDTGKILWTQAEGIDVESEKYAEVVKQELYFGGEGGIIGAMEKIQLDVLVIPSTLGIANDLAAKRGFPVVAVPLGYWDTGQRILQCRKAMVVLSRSH